MDQFVPFPIFTYRKNECSHFYLKVRKSYVGNRTPTVVCMSNLVAWLTCHKDRLVDVFSYS